METSEYRFVGTLAKLHGFKGAYTLIADHYLYEGIEKRETVFVEIDGLPIPFFISAIKVSNESSAIISFEDIDSPELAKEFIGCAIYISVDKNVVDEESDELEFDVLIGYTVVDSTVGEIGKVQQILEYSQNMLLEVKNGKQEYLIPISDNIIVKINHKKKILNINAPEGLLDINV